MITVIIANKSNSHFWNLIPESTKKQPVPPQNRLLNNENKVLITWYRINI